MSINEKILSGRTEHKSGKFPKYFVHQRKLVLQLTNGIRQNPDLTQILRYLAMVNVAVLKTSLIQSDYY